MIKSHVIQLGGLPGKQRDVVAARKFTLPAHQTVCPYQECVFCL